MAKRKLLWWSDFNITSGFGRLAHSILPHLVDKWDVSVLGILYTGDPHNMSGVRAYTAMRSDGVPSDVMGVTKLPEVIAKEKPDVVLIIQDPWIVSDIALSVESHGLDLARTVAYMPVDAPNAKENVASVLSRLYCCVFYTDFGLREYAKAGLHTQTAIIPHGVDTRLYRPVPRDIARHMAGFPEHLKDAFIVGSFHRNQPRKRVDLTIEYFAHWVKTHNLPENVYLYLHCAKNDPAGIDLPQYAEYCGVRNRVFLSGHLTPTQGVRDEQLVTLYNSCDVHVCTSMGEGWCCAPETPVDTLRGPVPIKDVVAGDLVVTHTGQFRKVSGVTHRQADGIVSLRRFGEYNPFRATPEHRHRVIRRRGPRKGFRKYIDLLKAFQRGEAQPVWAPVGTISPGDLIAIPKPDLRQGYPQPSEVLKITDVVPEVVISGDCVASPHSFQQHTGPSLTEIAHLAGCSFQYAAKVLDGTKGKDNLRSRPAHKAKKIRDVAECLGWTGPPTPRWLTNTIHVDAATAELFGLYIAEGWGDGARVGFASHALEVRARGLAQQFLQRVGVVSRTWVVGNKGYVIGSGALLSLFFTRLFGHGSHNKRIPDVLYRSQHIGAIIRGIFYGDGHFTKKHGYNFSTISTQLVHDLRTILACNGILLLVTQDKRKGKVCYILRVAREHEERFFTLVQPIKYESACLPSTTPSRYTRILEDQHSFYVPVRSVVYEAYSGTVHNLHVDDDASFTTNGMATHNSLPTHEGMACGVPQIAPDSGGLGEWARGTAVLVPCPTKWVLAPGINTIQAIPDKQSFVEALNRLYCNPEERLDLRRKGLALTSQKEFTWKSVAEKFHSVLSSVPD